MITFATHGTARHWPAWIGLILSLVIAAAAVMRARGEGVQLPEARSTSAVTGPEATAASTVTEPEPTPPAEPEVQPEAPALPEE